MLIVVPILRSVDDVRTFVEELHALMDVECARDEYFLHLKARTKLKGRLSAPLAHLRGRDVIVLMAYKIRSAFCEALEVLKKKDDEIVSALARATREVKEDRPMQNGIDLLSTDVRKTKFCYFGADGVSDEEALLQETRAWMAAGATPPPPQGDVIRKRIEDLEAKVHKMIEMHGGEEPIKWPFGEGKPLKDVFAADDAKNEFERMVEKIAELKQRLEDEE